MKLTKEEEIVLLALDELEPASLERIAERTGMSLERMEAILATLRKKGLLRDREPPF